METNNIDLMVGSAGSNTIMHAKHLAECLASYFVSECWLCLLLLLMLYTCLKLSYILGFGLCKMR